MCQGPSRSKSKESLLESESQFIAVDDPAQIIPTSQTDVRRPRQPSARERRRWKQLEEMAKEPKVGQNSTFSFPEPCNLLADQSQGTDRFQDGQSLSKISQGQT